jgi:MerR family redox-sensitive transcriptional activator SoxR
MSRARVQRSKASSGDLSIGEVARRVGLRPSALRYYESVGLLPPPRRINGRRRFDADVVRLLGTIRFAQQAGFTVAEIRTLFHGFGADVPPSARWRQLAKSKLAELDALVARAEGMRRALSTAMRCGCLRIEDCEFDPVEGCTLPAPTRVRRKRVTTPVE